MPAWWDFVSEPRSIMMPSAQYDTSFHTKAGMLADRPLTDQLIAHTTQMLRTYAQYYALDGQIRTLETSGQHDAAVAFGYGQRRLVVELAQVVVDRLQTGAPFTQRAIDFVEVVEREPGQWQLRPGVTHHPPQCAAA